MSTAESTDWFFEYANGRMDDGADFTPIKNKKLAEQYQKLIKNETCIAHFPNVAFVVCTAIPDMVLVTKVTPNEGQIATEAVPSTKELTNLLIYLKDHPELTG